MVKPCIRTSFAFSKSETCAYYTYTCVVCVLPDTRITLILFALLLLEMQIHIL